MSDEEQDDNDPVGVVTTSTPKPRPPPPSPYQPKTQVHKYTNTLSQCTDVVCGYTNALDCCFKFHICIFSCKYIAMCTFI